MTNPEDRPNFPKSRRIHRKYGEAMSKWMIELLHVIFVCIQTRLFDGSIRVHKFVLHLRPLSVNRLKSHLLYRA